MSAAQRLFVVGGNGFVGSSVCKQAVSRGWDVVSVSSSGRPYRTPKGHTPEWTHKVEWHAADALSPTTYRDLLAPCTAAVHSVGILLESQYKGVDGSFAGVLQGLAKGWGLASRGKPLASPADKEAQLTYERMNRDTAISVAETFAEVQREAKKTESPFVFVSSADIMRPIVSARYAGAKREAEAAIAQLAEREDALRPVFMRPGFMYHPHKRPWTTLPATLIDASYQLHRLHRRWRLPVPSPADMLQMRAVPEAMRPLAGAMTTPPLHVDTVASAVCEAVVRGDVRGAQEWQSIRRLAGWPDE